MTYNITFSLCTFSSADLPTQISKGRAQISELSSPSVPSSIGMRAESPKHQMEILPAGCPAVYKLGRNAKASCNLKSIRF